MGFELQLKQGTLIEKEHTKNPYVAEKIAKDHLKDNPDYYKYSSGKGKEYLINDRNKELFDKTKN